MACISTALPCRSRSRGGEKVAVESVAEVPSVSSEGWASLRPRPAEAPWIGGGPISTDLLWESEKKQQQRRQELACGQLLFPEPTVWWDKKKKRNNRKGFPDVGLDTLKECPSLWFNSLLLEPAWVPDAKAPSALNWTTSSFQEDAWYHHQRNRPTPQTVRRLCEGGQLKHAVDALSLVAQTETSGVSDLVFYSVLKRCIAENDLVQGRRVHDLVVKLGYESNAFLGNHLLRMYASQGRLQQATEVFRRVAHPDAFMWSSIIWAHAKHGQAKQAIQLYHEMRSRSRSDGVEPDCHVFVAALQACASGAELEWGTQVHADVVRSGVEPNLYVWNCLIDMYAKCGRLDVARQVFDEMTVARDVVTWTALIDGYAAQERGGQEALALYREMERQGAVAANSVTLACVVKACTGAGALAQGKRLHALIRERGMQADLVVGNCLLDMYVKCGALDEAREVFEGLPAKDVVTWTMMINGYGQCCEARRAVACFRAMVGAGARPNEATFTCLLGACSHEGLVAEGRRIFAAMAAEHGVAPTGEHINCMVDLLGRAGHLDEAEALLLLWVHQTGDDDDEVGFTSLLNACKSHGDVARGSRCFDALVRLRTASASAYVLMGALYAGAGMRADADRVARMRKAAGISKKPAVAGVEVAGHVRTFTVGGGAEDKGGDVSVKARTVNGRLKEQGGHLPRTELVRKAVRDKEDDLCGHAEKLALAYGLLHTPDGAPLLVTKNLRMCGDCHTSTEVMSRVEKREIVVRDAHRVHRFVDGRCRCAGRP